MNRNIWLDHYDPGVPHSLAPYPERTLADIIYETASQRPDHPALIFKGSAISYAQLEKLSTAFASALAGLGVKRDDRVALLLPNTPQMVIGLVGTWKVGGIVAPLNPLYTEHELIHALSICGADTVVVLTPFYNKIKEIQRSTHVRNVIATSIKEYLPPALRILFSLLKEKKEGHRITLQAGDQWLADLLQKHARGARPEIEIQPSDPAILLFSGGTTGTPKAALGTHQALVMSGMQVHAWFKDFLVDWDDIIMLNMPLFHAYGLAGVFSAGVVGRNPFAVIPNPRDLDDMVKTIHKVKPAFLPGVPTLFNAMLSHPKVEAGKADLKSIKLCISGASPLLAETKQRFETITEGRISEAYALSESMLAATMTPLHGAYKPGSVGLPLPDVEVRIVDSDTGENELALNQVGEILLRAPQLMVGYWQNPGETANVLRDGWLYTGDIGYLDSDGYLFIVDRKKDLIKPGGFQVWPREVEEVIASHPAVQEVCVGGVPDPYQVEAVKAWVVLIPDQQVGADELRTYCRENLAAYKVPKHIEFRDNLPKTTVGKILRRELASEHIAEAH
jgi:long-chain acyl-CoA synthetase